MKKFLLLLLSSVLFLNCKNDNSEQSVSQPEAGTKDTIASQIAAAHGFEEFSEVKQLNFTFNVMVNDTLRSSRSWKWFPQEKRAELTENNKTSSYTNDGELNEEEKALDQKLVNDTYWFLFPFQLEWSDYEMEHQNTAVAPISGDTLQRISVNYEGDGGYTPGDTYHIYVGDDNIVQEWTYVSSGGRTLSTTWEDYQKVDGLNISTMRKTGDGSFQIFFTDLEVTK